MMQTPLAPILAGIGLFLTLRALALLAGVFPPLSPCAELLAGLSILLVAGLLVVCLHH